ncbi:hypothetical protein A374_19045 [Fictibacillus macauensis ZFHKF-1]|uniref:Suppressor of fused-like domain-containing protein n=1 Tax=Fictibacillus macauensis ZFHKF-1 TaxID=1196324 RepID=I8ADM0_9BACL|nr:suppressor of fused domain protein [Fictibacillus macauensis]EIT83647.1 hypothetical protein A374_19045 [Fictibacillus macauensis ZFHKF-1]
MTNQQEMRALGWMAIDEHLETIYGDQEPKRYAPAKSMREGGDDPLEGVSVYECAEPVPHWHFVTHGFSELFEKESNNPEISGYGFELTLRVRKEEDETEPPGWTLQLIQNMGKYVFSTGNVFNPGDYLDANGPIAYVEDEETLLSAFAFLDDPVLQPLTTPNGKLRFVQVIGVTNDELEAIMTWNTQGVMKAANDVGFLPYYITDLYRVSILVDGNIVQKIEEGREQEGSATGFLVVHQLQWNEMEDGGYSLTIGKNHADVIGLLLEGRLRKDMFLSLASEQKVVTMKRGEVNNVEETDQEVQFTLTDETVAELQEKLATGEEQFNLTSFHLNVRLLEKNVQA